VSQASEVAKLGRPVCVHACG